MTSPRYLGGCRGQRTGRSSPSAVGAQKIPPDPETATGPVQAGCPNGIPPPPPSCCIPPPAAALPGGPAGDGGGVTADPGARRCPAEPHAGAGAHPPVAAPRDLDSAFPGRGDRGLPRFSSCPGAGGGLLGSGLPSAPKEELPASPPPPPHPRVLALAPRPSRLPPAATRDAGGIGQGLAKSEGTNSLHPMGF